MQVEFGTLKLIFKELAGAEESFYEHVELLEFVNSNSYCNVFDQFAGCRSGVLFDFLFCLVIFAHCIQVYGIWKFDVSGALNAAKPRYSKHV